ncbi:MAG: triose-phosphate isomerase [Terriglobia bacterium]
MRHPVMAGNWKMYKTVAEALAFIRELRPRVANATHCEIIVAPPFTALKAVAEAAAESNIRVAAQDVAFEKEGAFTGDISTSMLREAGCTYVIIGHSERRQHHGETDEQVNRKVKAALRAELIPIVCLGETLSQRETGKMQAILQGQFTEGLSELTTQEFSRIILAYEPVWAIGTGKTATPEIAAQSHGFLRRLAGDQFGAEAASQLRILYGGSVKPDNIQDLMAQEEIDGALVGGASLSSESFSAIVRYPEGA